MNIMSIKKNVLYSSILTVSSYFFPMLTYPYVSRVLGVTNIGICNFIDSIVNYYILFSMMGIGTVAIREIAKDSIDREQLTRTFSSLFVLNTISTLVGLIILFISIFSVLTLYEYKEMMYIGAFKLVFNYLLIEWLYKGLEDFKYITQRSIFVKCVYVLLVFLFVREKNDYEIYYIISVSIIIINAIINLLYARRHVGFTIRGLSIRPYLKSFFILGIYAFLTSMYTSFNVAYLGFVAGETEVGYYTTAVKLYTILLSLFTAFTGVMMPRMSALVANHQRDEFKALMGKSVNVLLLFVMPLIVFSVIFAPQIIRIIAGEGYEAAVLPMRIVMPLMLIIGYEQIVIIQVLVPLKKDRAVLINSVLGASVGVIMNLLLVSVLKSVGSALVWLVSELVVLCSGQYFLEKYMGIIFPFKLFALNILLTFPIGLLCSLLLYLPLSDFFLILAGGMLVGIYYITINILVTKNIFFITCIHQIKKVLCSLLIVVK